MKKLIWLLLLLLFLGESCSTNKVGSMILNRNWKFRKLDSGKWMDASVPGTVHTDLLANKVIEDPFYRVNEKGMQWIDKEDWEYITKFRISGFTLHHRNLELLFKGLDTYATIYINDSLVAKTDNMFREWHLNPEPFLKKGENTLRIVFHSPIKVGLDKLEKLGYGLPAANDQSESGGLGDKKVSVFTRKAGYHFGWDWGPRLVTSGIWRPVELVSWKGARINNTFYKLLHLETDTAFYTADIELEADHDGPGEVLITSVPDKSVSAKEKVALKKGTNKCSIAFFVVKPRLWWTNGLGDPFLYTMRCVLQMEGKTCDTKDTKVGIRSVRVVQNPDEKGKSFYFELNGMPVFMKGANYIPNDNFLPRVTTTDYEKIVSSARDANMNMLRVWGGGIYENDILYDLCDQYGILVWQDFMFACSMYPGDHEFLENVRQEAVQNVRRLRNHASIALWCGNNEIHAAWAPGATEGGWGWKKSYTTAQQDEIWHAYDTLFNSILPAVIEENTFHSFYWPSSPMAADGALASYSSASGDMHYWGVWHGLHPFTEFENNIGRFMSEYGFQSFPELKTVETYTVPGDRDITSEVMASHQRSGIGNLRIKEYMTDQYKMPSTFESFLYVSQLLQAEGVRMGIEAHRRNMPYCMGSLYWQINDCWPVASWSGIDYSKQWKALHYFARDSYKPVILSAVKKNNTVDLYVISDRIKTFNGTLTLHVMDVDGKVNMSEKHTVLVKNNTSEKIYSLNTDAWNTRADANRLFLVCELADDSVTIAQTLTYFVSLKDLNLPVAEVNYRIEKAGKGLQITLHCDHLAKNVYLSLPGLQGFFNDNYFDLIPGRDKAVIYKGPISFSDAKKKLKIITLNKVYHE
jgi:beta-mannosidase